MDSAPTRSQINARDRLYRCDAIVLRRMDLGETDRILTLLSDRFGKIRVIGKGIRRPTARLGPHLELFSTTRLMLSRARDLDVITSAETLDLHGGLRSNLDALGVASHCAELVDRFLADRDENRTVYRLMGTALERLDSGANPDRVARWFEVVLLGEMGVRPELFNCVVCDKPVGAEPNRFSVRLGGIMCHEHSDRDISAIVLSVATQKVFRLLIRGDLDAFLRLNVSEPVLRELETVLTAFITHQLERDLNSLKVMRRVGESLPAWDDYRSTK
jgi:DNA repair protein RecO (recombination protein O)